MVDATMDVMKEEMDVLLLNEQRPGVSVAAATYAATATLNQQYGGQNGEGYECVLAAETCIACKSFSSFRVPIAKRSAPFFRVSG